MVLLEIKEDPETAENIIFMSNIHFMKEKWQKSSHLNYDIAHLWPGENSVFPFSLIYYLHSDSRVMSVHAINAIINHLAI